MRGGRVGDEELPAVGVRPAIGHAQEARSVVDQAGLHFVRDHVADLAAAVAEVVATLDHEVRDGPVKRGSVEQGSLDPGCRARIPERP